MINVHAAANKAVQAVNPDLIGTFYASTGNTVAADGKQTPTYAAGVNVPMQVQGLDAKDLKQLQNLSAEEVKRSVHMFGDTQGVVRVANKGGDLLWLRDRTGGALRLWKVVKVFETWSDWCRVAVVLQTDAAPPSPPPSNPPLS